MTEFVVVVFGVLVALGVNEWRDEHEDRIVEAEYLNRLRVDIESDVEQFLAFDRILENKSHFLQSLLDGTTNAEFGSDAEALMVAVVYSSFKGLPDSVSTTFDELQSTGRLALIQDVDRRDALSKYYSGFEHMSGVFAQPFGDYTQFLFAAVPGAVFREWGLSRSVSRINELRSALDELQRKPELTSVVNSEIAYSTSMQFTLAGYRDQAETLLQLLDE